MKGVDFKIDDEIQSSLERGQVSFEAEGINVGVDHTKLHGFCVSIFDKKKKIMRYYSVQEGLLVLDTKERLSMLRDDIRDKIFELIKLLFADDTFVVEERQNFIELNMDAVDVTALSEALIIEFDLEDIPFAKIMEWQRVSDIINHIEDTLEEKQPPASKFW